MKERTFIAGFMELEFSLSYASIEKQIDHCRQGGYSYRSKACIGKIIHDFSDGQ